MAMEHVHVYPGGGESSSRLRSGSSLGRWRGVPEHVIALEARGKGLLGITLQYPYEVRKEDEGRHFGSEKG